MSPKVSVCIPAFNRRDMFRATLWSVLRQTHQDLEVIVSDNASEEDLGAEVEAARDRRVRYIRHSTNVKNFHFLQTLATGKYVLFLCSDDLLLPECLATASAALDNSPARGGAVYMAAHYSQDGFQYLSRMPARPFAAAHEYAIDASVRDFHFASPSLCLYRRETFERIGGWDPELVAVGDWEMYARMVRKGGGMVFIHEVLAIMRLHDNRHSNTTALHWDFYDDIMKLSARPEYAWGAGYRGKALAEQLLWDWRLRRWPERTLKHAYETGGLPAALLYLPWEVVRRAAVKIRNRLTPTAGSQSSSCNDAQLADADLTRAEQLWHASERIRLSASAGIHARS